MSYAAIREIEKDLRSKKEVDPDDIKDAKSKIQDLKNRGMITDEELEYTKIMFQSRVAKSPSISNSLSISAIAISLLTGAFSIIKTDDAFYQILYTIATVSIAIVMLFFNSTNNKTYNSCASCTIMIAIIDEII
ncbi:hypothetical protein [Paenibacillus sp. DMB5]|uniref:hypothetical protein n=1 Tax=Paenibacillus sp. DMB5 TaxID=1780103 RepID=UPI00076BD032|nr:hypothetical protein [Paenibacillus sp. DMB5]KUP22400.1 hypothetical protein AWJ19_27665 [Paenibacillus sp. DMB5]